MKIVLAAACIIIIAGIGIWLGEFGWFGGYIATQQALSVASLLLGIIGAGLICENRPISFLTVPIYFIFSQVVFTGFWALGQTFYMDPPANEFYETFIYALNGEL